MRFWIRELAGWVLVGLGLLTFYGCYEMLLRRNVVETGTLTVIGIFLFRGGIHLLKMAVAAQICLQAQQEAKAESAIRKPGRAPKPEFRNRPRAGQAFQPDPSGWKA
jgi:hypothetical protein